LRAGNLVDTRLVVALIPPFFLDCVVAIGTDDYDAERVWIASGFLYGRYLKQEAAEKIYQP